jgi:DNA-binding NarL/FixJ family response regulator
MQKYNPESSYENIVYASICANLIKEVHNRKKIRFVSIDGKSISISNREFQCVKLLAHGRRVKEIAKSLEISHRTVECYLSILKDKAACYCHEQILYGWRKTMPISNLWI